MKPNQEQIEDQLLDALLHEQNRSDREQALKDIEAAIIKNPAPFSIPLRSNWPKRLGVIAASVAIGGLAGIWLHSSRKDDLLAKLEVQESREEQRVDLMTAIRAQEEKVEESRKLLTTISRTKDIRYRGEGEAKNDAIERGLDAQDYADAKRNYLADQEQLQSMKLKQLEKEGAEVGQYLAAKEPTRQTVVEGLSSAPSEPMARPRIVPPPASARGELPELATRTNFASGVVDDVGAGGGEPIHQRLTGMRSIPVDESQDTELLAGDQEAAYSIDQSKILEVEKINLITQIEGLLKYESEQLLTYASGLNLPDNIIKSLYPQYLELKRQVDGQKASGLGGNHPTVLTNQRVLNSMKDDLDKGVVDLRTRLQGQLEMAKERLEKAEARKLDAIAMDGTVDSERYGPLIDAPWQRPTENPLSTFSIDVDTASYANIRRMIREGRQIPADAVRIEECINAFKYQYEPPADGKAFAVQTELATCPWNENNLLVKFGIKGREIAREKRPVSNLVFLIDVSGSMQSSNKLPLVKESLKLLLHQLDERDSVSYVVYAGSEGVVLPPTKITGSGRVQALEALEKLEAGGSTNGGAGITRAYQLAMENFIEGGVNRVILASDGDFNVGVTGQDALVKLVKERAATNVYLSALAFGTGNLNDAMFEAISNDGNGNYFYIDDIREARKVFLENLTGSLITIAKDVKIQVEFNPRKVGSYRLIGYANRVLKDEDFNDDKVDAGDIGAGHTVTAFYEIVPAGLPQPNGGGVDSLKYQKTSPEVKAPAAEPGDEWLTLKLRHKHPEGDISALQETVVKGQATPWQESGSDFQFATAVAMFGMKLRGMSDVADIPWNGVRQLARSGLKDDQSEDRAELVELIGELEKRSR